MKTRNKWGVIVTGFKKSAAIIKCARIKLICNNKIFFHLITEI